MENNCFFVGVLTKPDLVDKGAEPDILNMVRFPDRFQIRKGFSVVKMRSKQEVTENVSLEEALSREQKWFERSPHFRSVLPSEIKGQRTISTLGKARMWVLSSMLPAQNCFLFSCVARQLPKFAMGTKSLARKLTHELVDRIKVCVCFPQV